MQIKPLYIFIRPDGGVTASLIKPDCEYTEEVRLIADEGKLLTNGETVTPCIDTDTAEGWWEIDAPPEEIPEEMPEEIPEEEEDDTTMRAARDTAYSPEEYAGDWERVENNTEEVTE